MISVLISEIAIRINAIGMLRFRPLLRTANENRLRKREKCVTMGMENVSGFFRKLCHII